MTAKGTAAIGAKTFPAWQRCRRTSVFLRRRRRPARPRPLPPPTSRRSAASRHIGGPQLLRRPPAAACAGGTSLRPRSVSRPGIGSHVPKKEPSPSKPDFSLGACAAALVEAEVGGVGSASNGSEQPRRSPEAHGAAAQGDGDGRGARAEHSGGGPSAGRLAKPRHGRYRSSSWRRRGAPPVETPKPPTVADTLSSPGVEEKKKDSERKPAASRCSLTSSEPSEPVKEPTMMKQAAELLEEAPGEAGGSMEEIGNNLPSPSRTRPRTTRRESPSRAPLRAASRAAT